MITENASLEARRQLLLERVIKLFPQISDQIEIVRDEMLERVQSLLPTEDELQLIKRGKETQSEVVGRYQAIAKAAYDQLEIPDPNHSRPQVVLNLLRAEITASIDRDAVGKSSIHEHTIMLLDELFTESDRTIRKPTPSYAPLSRVREGDSYRSQARCLLEHGKPEADQTRSR